jgi:chromosome segregation protein
MTPRLKSLELHGYKTFASRTQFEFPGVITCVVGPNGSGKSNIADSIRWVLGEQSYSLLRGRKTEDMIFAGSEQRPRAGMASATIIFDNSDGWLPIDFAEVGITRRAYRDGTNEYLLNGQRVRLKEISELLAQSGLAERTYTIIGQGLVDAALSLKPEERRRFFEEAAGIGLYRSRREESLNRLDATRRNLERVSDILAELGPRLQSLEKQARRAQEYERVRADLRLLLRDWYGFHWHRNQQDLVHAREVLRAQELRQQQARQRLAEMDAQLNQQREKLATLRGQLNGWHNQSSELHRKRERISRDLAVLDERQRSFQQQELDLKNERSRREDDLEARNSRVHEIELEVTAHQTDLVEAQDQASLARKAMQARQREREQIEFQVREQRREQVTVQSAQVKDRAHLEELNQRLQTIERNHQSMVRSIQSDEQASQKAEQDLLLAVSARELVQHEAAELEGKRAELRSELDRMDEKRSKLNADRTRIEVERGKVTAQLEVLIQAERSFSGLNQGARFLLDSARQGRLAKGYTALSQVIEVPAEYEQAVAAVLGELLDAVFCEDTNLVEPALILLENGSKGRAVLVPLSPYGEEILFTLPKDSEILGIASEIVKAPESMRKLTHALLGQVLVVKDRMIARQLIGKIPSSGRIVTLKGEVFWGNGIVVAGQDGRAGVIGRPRQKRELQEVLDKSSVDLQHLLTTVSELEKSQNQIRQQLQSQEQVIRQTTQKGVQAAQAYQQANLAREQVRQRLDFQKKQGAAFEGQNAQTKLEITQVERRIGSLGQKITGINETIQKLNETLGTLPVDEYQRAVIHWDTAVAVARRALQDSSNRLADQNLEMKGLQVALVQLTERMGVLNGSAVLLLAEKEKLRAEEHSLNQEIEELQVLITPAEMDLDRLEKEYLTWQGNQQTAQQAAGLADRQANQAQIETTRLREGLDSLRRRIEDDFGLVAFEYSAEVSGPTPLPLDGMVEQLPRMINLPADLEDNINRQRGQLRRMGAVNPEAQKEFLEVKERHQFLIAQVEDLRKADADLRQVIAELDELMRKEFRRTFNAVAAEFKVMFTRLFGGGSARLIMLDEEHPNETGIDIEARLPGRREQGLSLLSGGERSLTAVALVFSLLKVSPTPFCVMDEVDAMLDEANVGRFRDLLVELSNLSQFIVITHNRNTVQAADVIYGITMGRDSASQTISLRLDEVGEEMVR